MLAKYEYRRYSGEEKVWIGQYLNLTNAPHWHYDDELVYVKKGDAVLVVSGNSYPLSCGEAAFIQSGKIHYLKGSKDSLLSFLIYDSSLTSFLTKKKELASPVLKDGEEVNHFYLQIEEEYQKKLPYYEEKVSSLVKELLIQIFRRYKTVEAKKEKDPLQERYRALLEEIDEKYDTITFSEAASFLALSQPYFSKYFEKMSGMNFSSYLNLVRVEKAIQLLQSEKKTPITEVATKSGFSSLRNFNLVFKKLTGYSPKALPFDYSYQGIVLPTNCETFDPTGKDSKLLS